MREVYVASSVVRSTVENVSSPTLLMSDVIKVVSDVVGRDVVVGAGLVPATVDTLTPVTRSAVIARTESFLTSIKFLFVQSASGLKYIECSNQQYSRDSTISKMDNFEK